MSTCDCQATGDIEQFFYGELAGADRRRVEEHLAACGACRELLEELAVIQYALSTSPDVSAPPGGDWSHFMGRLDTAVQPPRLVVLEQPRVAPRRAYAGRLALAALLALITMSVVAAMRDRDRAIATRQPQVASASGTRSVAPVSTPTADREGISRLAVVTEQHFERSKLVVLGLATKDPAHVSAADWVYERQLASNLLDDTRLYRQAAEEHGMEAVAGVMRDLELVLLQTSLGEASDPATLAQIQRSIRKRDLVTRMNVLTTGL